MIYKCLTLISKFLLLLYKSFHSVIAILCFSKPAGVCSLKRLINEGRSQKSCLVVGNGPSVICISDKISRVCNNFDVIAMNYFALTKMFDELKPRFYVLLDDVIFGDCSTQSKKNEQLLAKLHEVDHEFTLFVPVDHRRSRFTKALKNSQVRVCYFNATPIDGFEWFRNFCYACHLGMPRPETVAISAIFLALQMGYSKIQLIGCEHSWLQDLVVDDENVWHLSLPHFYREADTTSQIGSMSLSSFLIRQANCFKSHELLASYGKRLNCCVLNSTPHSYIDAYPRKPLF